MAMRPNQLSDLSPDPEQYATGERLYPLIYLYRSIDVYIYLAVCDRSTYIGGGGIPYHKLVVFLRNLACRSHHLKYEIHHIKYKIHHFQCNLSRKPSALIQAKLLRSVRSAPKFSQTSRKSGGDR